MKPSARLLPDLGQATCVYGARTCYDSYRKASTEGDAALISRLANVGHSSVLEHSNYAFWMVANEHSVLQLLLDRRCRYLRFTPFQGSQTRWVVSGNFWAWRSALQTGRLPYQGNILTELKNAAPAVFGQIPDLPLTPNRAGLVPLGVYPREGVIPLSDEEQAIHTRLCFEVITSRGLSCQIHRHRSFSVSQRSQRYVDEGESEFILPPGLTETQAEELSDCIASGVYDYGTQRRNGMRKEDARYVLPPAVKTVQVITANLDDLRHFFQLRALDRHAQHETRHVAQEMLTQAAEAYPKVFGDFVAILGNDEALRTVEWANFEGRRV